jgi:hypothetical protein
MLELVAVILLARLTAAVERMQVSVIVQRKVSFATAMDNGVDHRRGQSRVGHVHYSPWGTEAQHDPFMPLAGLPIPQALGQRRGE